MCCERKKTYIDIFRKKLGNKKKIVKTLLDRKKSEDKEKKSRFTVFAKKKEQYSFMKHENIS